MVVLYSPEMNMKKELWRCNMAQFNTREEMKQKAVEVMQQLDIYKPYINGFKAKDSKPCLYTGWGRGDWLYQFPGHC